MHIRFINIIWILILFSQYCCAQEQINSEDVKLDSLLEVYIERLFQLFPLEATYAGDHRFDDRFTNTISIAHRKKQRSLYSEYLNKLKAINRTNLSTQGKQSYDIFQYDLELMLEGMKYPDYLIPINQMSSMPLTFIRMGSGGGIHPFRTVRDYENYLNRITGFQEWVHTAISNMRIGINRGIVQPKIVIYRTIPQLKAQIVDSIEQCQFYLPIKHFPEHFDNREKERLRDLYTDAIRHQIIPTYQKLVHFLEKEYLTSCRQSIGLSELHHGKEWYTYLIRFYTTTNLTPEELLEMGLKEVERIGGLIDSLQLSLDFSGSRNKFRMFARNTTRFYSSEKALIREYNRLYKKLKKRMVHLFNHFPKSELEIRPIEKYLAYSASDHYQPATPDGSRPGIFYLNTYGIENRPSPIQEALFLHEAIPGHHFQLSLQRELAGLPLYRRLYWNSGYGEGWALYCENLGQDLKLYRDPYQKMIKLIMEMNRAIRLVVDVGMHVKGWTKKEAIDFCMKHSTSSYEFVENQIERYIAWPGQALAYKVGELKILELRACAKEKWGEHFDIRAFHDMILEDGCLPLDLLERKYSQWILDEKNF